jgi:hypothetical protein
MAILWEAGCGAATERQQSGNRAAWRVRQARYALSVRLVPEARREGFAGELAPPPCHPKLHMRRERGMTAL